MLCSPDGRERIRIYGGYIWGYLELITKYLYDNTTLT